MPRTRRKDEGWLMIDHRESPGVTDNEMIGFNPDFWPGAGKGLTECPICICGHCQRTMIIKPDRTREFPYCRSCDDDICEACAWTMQTTGEHKSFKQHCDETIAAVTHGLPVPILQRIVPPWLSVSSPSPPSR
jgi:hypothetical protein